MTRLRRSRAALASSLLLLITAAAVSTSCGGSIARTGSGTSSDGGESSGTCPADQPTLGAACSPEGLECDWQNGACAGVGDTCVQGHWQEVAHTDPGPPCPDSVPRQGDDCSEYCLSDTHGTCTYSSGCGSGAMAVCQNGRWSVSPYEAPCDGGAWTDAGCTESLSDTGCPATYEGAVAQCDQSPGAPGSRAGLCGSQLLYEQATPFSPNFCAYDPSTHALVGAYLQSDAPQYCGDASATAQAGQPIDTSCTFSRLDCGSTAADAATD